MDGSFGAGFLEGVAQVAADQAPCLLIAYDTGYPEPLHSHRPIPDPFGVALLLTPQATARTLAQVQAGVTRAPATTMADAALERLRTSAPAARALPLLQAIATGTAGTVVLDYLDELRLEVGITPTAPDARA
jgi:hypothetical protein